MGFSLHLPERYRSATRDASCQSNPFKSCSLKKNVVQDERCNVSEIRKKNDQKKNMCPHQKDMRGITPYKPLPNRPSLIKQGSKQRSEINLPLNSICGPAVKQTKQWIRFRRGHAKALSLHMLVHTLGTRHMQNLCVGVMLSTVYMAR